MDRRLKTILFALVLVATPFLVSAYTSPGFPQGLVNDFAKILLPADIQSMETQLRSFRDKTSVEIAVVTVSSLGDETIETYAVKLFEEWQIGNKHEDNGLLILVAPNDRKVRIEVGYGLEGTVTDLQSGNIIREVMTPAFKEDNYTEGIAGAVNAVIGIILKDPSTPLYNEATGKGNWDFPFEAFFFVFIILINVFGHILGKSKSWWLGGVIGAAIGGVVGLIFGFLFAGVISIVALTILGLVFDFFVSKRPPGSGRGGIWPIFFGGGRGGSGGGGFGGFGGGSSGGGGASGSW